MDVSFPLSLALESIRNESDLETQPSNGRRIRHHLFWQGHGSSPTSFPRKSSVWNKVQISWHKGGMNCKNYIKIVKYRHTGLSPGTQASNLRLVSLAPYFHLCHQFPEGILCLPFLICWQRWSGCIGSFWFEFPKKFSPSSFSSAWAPAAAHLELTLFSFSECDGNSRVSYLYSNFNIFLEFHQLKTSSLST